MARIKQSNVSEGVFRGGANVFDMLSIASVLGSAGLMLASFFMPHHEGTERLRHRSLFVGQWAPTLAIFGRVLGAQTQRPEPPFAPQTGERAFGDRIQSDEQTRHIPVGA